MNELFGFTIYTPLTADEHERLKDGGTVPKWMNEFSSLPDLAIPLSYVCVGVAFAIVPYTTHCLLQDGGRSEKSCLPLVRVIYSSTIGLLLLVRVHRSNVANFFFSCCSQWRSPGVSKSFTAFSPTVFPFRDYVASLTI